MTTTEFYAVLRKCVFRLFAWGAIFLVFVAASISDDNANQSTTTTTTIVMDWGR